MSAEARRRGESSVVEGAEGPHRTSEHDRPVRRSVGAASIRVVYLGLYSLVSTVIGGRRGRAALARTGRIAVDKALGPEADPEMTADVTAVGAQMPTVIGLVATLPALLLYPLYEVPAVLTAVLPFMMTCTALSLTQAVRHMAAAHDRSRWQAAGRPPHWRPSALARPSGIDIVAWLALAALLIWGTG